MADRPVESSIFFSLPHVKCGCRLTHLYFPLPVLVDVFLGTTRTAPKLLRAFPRNAHNNPSDQRRRAHFQLKLPYASQENLSEQYYWLTQQLNVPRFNRSICQGYWCSQKPLAARMSNTKYPRNRPTIAR